VGKGLWAFLKSAYNYGSFDFHIGLFEEKICGPGLVDFFGDLNCHFRKEYLNRKKNVFNILIFGFPSGSKST
jgi:hypothetical protein